LPFLSAAITAGRKGSRVFLDWHLRFRIIEGFAQGVVYLHHHSRLRLIHRDLKAENILLDCDMNPRITGFRLANVLKSNEEESEAHLEHYTKSRLCGEPQTLGKGQ
jgi:serine/threonine protein kinase